MVNYSNGKIYMIEPVVEHDEGDIYIGSTTKDYLSQRLATHVANYKQFKKKDKIRQTTSFELFDKYGVENCKIVLLENAACSNKNELTARESHYIRTLKCVNKFIPLRTRQEYKLENKEQIKKQQKNYYESQKYFITCECGCIVSKLKLWKHVKTQKHHRLLNLRNDEKNIIEEEVI
jgi:hypothetical protein